MAKILNLDKIVETSKSKQRELVISGVTYKIPEMTVLNFIETTKAAIALEKSGADVPSQIEATIDLIMRSVPDVSRDVLLAYPLNVLGTIANFVRGEEVEGEEEVATEGEAGK